MPPFRKFGQSGFQNIRDKGIYYLNELDGSNVKNSIVGKKIKIFKKMKVIKLELTISVKEKLEGQDEGTCKFAQVYKFKAGGCRETILKLLEF